MEFELIFQDNFEGDKLDEGKWTCEIGNGIETMGIWAWGVGSREYCTRENVVVKDGTLKIIVKKEILKKGTSFTSGRITTKNSFSLRYGRLEARMRLPCGQGFWPAFWLMPVSAEPYGKWPSGGEIDIVEANGKKPEKVSCALHYGGPGAKNRVFFARFYDLPDGQRIDDWHIYAVEWAPDEIKWFVDGVPTHSMRAGEWWTADKLYKKKPVKNENKYAPFDRPFYIIINCHVGGGYVSKQKPQVKDLPGVLEVDYVKAYELKA